jgi:two-component system, NarL family, sensor kinase
VGPARRRHFRAWPSGHALLSGALGAAVLVAYMVAVYAAVLAAGWTDPHQHAPALWLHPVALLLIALTVRPIHGWVQPSIDRLIYDWHDDPYSVLAVVGQHLDPDVQDPRAIVPTIAASIAATLRLPYVSITTEMGGESISAAHGLLPARGELAVVPLAYRGNPIGILHAAPRRTGEILSARDMQLLEDLARQVGIALHAARLGESLQLARERLVTAREEERRRIRRDLHDGLAPTLASVRMQLAAARRLVRDDPDGAARMLDELREDVRAATADIRRLVYDLRPPLLDEHGLLGALRDMDGVLEGCVLTLALPGDLPPLPAAVEVAAYRIASEAVHNVAKHARASHCTLSLVVSQNALVLEISDDGQGLPAEVSTGVGLVSMRERAAELGGSLTINPAPGGGTCVAATLPLDAVPR